MTALAVQEPSDFGSSSETRARAGALAGLSAGGSADRTHSAAGREGAHIVEMQQRRLLLGVCEVLAEDGLEHASIGSICKRAGVSRRTFYDLFEDREAAVSALLEETAARLRAEIEPVYSGEAGVAWQGRVRAALTVLLEFFDGRPALARVCLVETMKGGPSVQRLRQQLIGGLAAAIDRDGARAAGMRKPPPLAAQAVVGGAISILQTRLLERDPHPLIELVNALTGTIALPYLGAATARREAMRPVPSTRESPPNGHISRQSREPFKDISLRLTFRTARVLAAIHECPGSNNRQIGAASGIADQGQISKLLRRLAGYGLVENTGREHSRGEPNAWTLTQRGLAIHQAVQAPAS